MCKIFVLRTRHLGQNCNFWHAPRGPLPKNHFYIFFFLNFSKAYWFWTGYPSLKSVCVCGGGGGRGHSPHIIHDRCATAKKKWGAHIYVIFGQATLPQKCRGIYTPPPGFMPMRIKYAYSSKINDTVGRHLSGTSVTIGPRRSRCRQQRSRRVRVPGLIPVIQPCPW